MFGDLVGQRSFVHDPETCIAFFEEYLDLIERNLDFESSSYARFSDLEDYH
jgi:hypothetical protein